jgi:acyl-CoA thioester hydrolase
MARPDPSALVPAAYPHHVEIATRYGDQDTNGHINNVALSGVVEDARVRLHYASALRGAFEADGGQIMLASFTIDYLAQAHYPEPIAVHSGLLAVGRSSFRIRHLLMQGETPVALAESVTVHVKDGRGSPLPQAFLDTVSEWMITQ